MGLLHSLCNKSHIYEDIPMTGIQNAMMCGIIVFRFNMGSTVDYSREGHNE